MKETRNVWKYVSVLLMMVIVVSFSFYSISAHPGSKVNLAVDGDVHTVYTEAVTVEGLIDELVQSHQLAFTDEMKVVPEGNAAIKPGMTVKVLSLKHYTLLEDGEPRVIESYENQVEEILNEVGYKLDDSTYTVPSLKAEVASGSTIEVVEVEKTRQVRVVSVPAPVRYVEDPNLYIGQEKVLEEGKDGAERLTAESIYYNGMLLDSRVVESEAVEAAEEKVVVKGTKEAAIVETPNGPLAYERELVMEATAYDNSFASCGKHPGHPQYGITATGTAAGPGTVAVDPRVIPLGTKLYVESMDGTASYGYATALDTGGAIKGNRIDLWHPTHEEAMEFGRRPVKVYVLFDMED